MHRIFPLLLASLCALALASPTPAADRPAKAFAHPERIRYDGDCIQIEGQDTFIYSAAFHYFRTPKELWRDRLTKIREAGFNTIETYVPWNWHEREMPKGLDDFSQIDLSELKAFLDLAHDEFGLYSIVRPGPFICAEWAGGGYPRWLAKFAPATTDDKAPLWLRGSSDSHIAWSVHWYMAVCKMLAAEQLTRKPAGAKGMILLQIENEYNHHGTPGKDKVLRALRDAALASGIDVPLFTCLTNECRGSMDPALSQVFDSDNYYIGRNQAADCALRMAALKQKQPDAPGMVTELQGGWFSGIGGSLSSDHYSDAAHYNAINLMSLLGGATVLNPYMFVGGTHFDNWGARGMTTSYDYNAAIRENGAVGAKYQAAKAIGDFLGQHGRSLLRSRGGPCALAGAPNAVAGGIRVAADGTRFVFLHNSSATAAFTGMLTLTPGSASAAAGPLYNTDQHGNQVRIDLDAPQGNHVAAAPIVLDCQLAPMAAMVLVVPPGKSPAEGQWFPQEPTTIRRPASLPSPVRIATASRQPDPTDGRWRACPAHTSLPELGISDHRIVRYRTRVELDAAQAAGPHFLLIRSFSRDIVHASVNGRPTKRTFPDEAQTAKAGRVLATSHQRIKPNEFDNRFDLTGLLRAGSNEILLVYENIGHEHGYVPMEELSGIDVAGLGADESTITRPLELEWEPALGGEHQSWPAGRSGATSWLRHDLDTSGAIPAKGNNIQPKTPRDGLVTWYRMEFSLPEQTEGTWVPWLLRLNASGNGPIWLNGHNIGKHHEVGPQREFFLPECWLRFGPGQTNTLVLALCQTCHGAHLRAAEVAPYTGSAELRTAPAAALRVSADSSSLLQN